MVEVLNRLVRQRGAPKYLFADNGAEFTGRLVDLRTTTTRPGVTSRGPARRLRCAYRDVQRILRDECLNLHWFDSIAKAKQLFESWRGDYNESRPHRAFGNIPPREYASRMGTSNALVETLVGEN